MLGEKDRKHHELVIDGADYWVVWDSTHGAYKVYQGVEAELWRLDEHEPVDVLWKDEFENRFGVYDGREPPLLLWKQDGSYKTVGSNESQAHRWHIIQSGSPVCHSETRSPEPYDDNITPIKKLSEAERTEKLEGVSNLCAHCMGYPLPDTDQQA